LKRGERPEEERQATVARRPNPTRSAALQVGPLVGITRRGSRPAKPAPVMAHWDAAERIEAGADIAAVAAAFAAAIAPYGYAHSVLAAFLPTDRGPPPYVFFANTPDVWRQTYLDNNMSAVDSVIAESRRRIAPFTWAELLAMRPEPPEEQPLSAFTDAWGLEDGFVVPIHGPGGYVAVASLLSTRELPPPTPEQRAWLYMVSFLAHERCRALTGVDPGSQLSAPLSMRERDCLRWVAAGKSDWEIGRILGIAPTTVKFHIDRARNKLGVHSRAQAVARLFLWGGS